MKVGAVILNFNSWKMTAKLAKKMAKFAVIDDVIVVDNVSTDDSYINLQKLENDKITTVQSEKNGGYSYGNNFGARILEKKKCDILIVSNPDVDVEEEAIKKIIDVFKNNSDYGMLSGIEYNIDNNVADMPIWKMNSYKDDLMQCFFIGRKITKRNSNIDYSKTIQDVEMIKGSFFAIRMSDFIEIGGFDENVFLFCEERIISRKITNHGKKIGIVTNIKYNHNHSASINKEYKSIAKQMKLLYKSRYYYNCKYNNINVLEKSILLSCMKISIMEYSILDMIKMKTR